MIHLDELHSSLERHTRVREQALADGIRDVAAELRLVDVIEWVSLCHMQKHANIGDIVTSSAELFFRDGALSYRRIAEVDLRWGSTPSILLELEFKHGELSAFFSLGLRALHASVHIHCLSRREGFATPDAATKLLISSITEARRVATLSP